jgi:drug/metabolite transporter (DMT)-like permease
MGEESYERQGTAVRQARDGHAVALVISLAIAVLGVVMLVNGAGAGWVAVIGGLVMAAFYAITSRPANRRGERPGGQFSHAGDKYGPV